MRQLIGDDPDLLAKFDRSLLESYVEVKTQPLPLLISNFHSLHAFDNPFQLLAKNTYLAEACPCADSSCRAQCKFTCRRLHLHLCQAALKGFKV